MVAHAYCLITWQKDRKFIYLPQLHSKAQDKTKTQKEKLQQ